MTGYTILKADDGGFAVVPNGNQPGTYGYLLFAGTIAECLEYVRQKMTEAPIASEGNK